MDWMGYLSFLWRMFASFLNLAWRPFSFLIRIALFFLAPVIYMTLYFTAAIRAVLSFILSLEVRTPALALCTSIHSG